MRIQNSIKNIIASMLSNVLTIIIGLASQAIFIKLLGAEYLGLNGLFSNIISMLGIVELGIGNAIIYNLYKPIAEKNIEQIKSLMKFYQKSYHLIALIVSIIGVALIPLLPFIIDEVNININANIIYLLFLIEIICSYILSYKRSILYADQKNYIINIIHIIYTIMLNIFQLSILYFTKNYYFYLIVKIIFRVLENIVITIVANKKYEYLLDNDIKPLDKKIKKDIFIKVKALFFHKIGTFIVMGTDNIIISRFLGLITVGLYSNYYLIIDAVNKLFGQALNSLTPSVGNLLVEDNKEKQYDVFKKVRFLNFWIASFAGTAILIIIQSFITIWIGKKYLLNFVVLSTLVFNFYQKMMRNSYMTFKEAAGIYHEDRFVPLVESILNIVISIILVKLIGLAGVFIGTIVSGFSLWFYSYPKFVYKKLFDRKYIDYAKETLGYILLFIIIASISYIISININFEGAYLEFIKNCISAVIVPNIILLIIFYKSDNFNYYKNLIFSKLKKGA